MINIDMETWERREHFDFFHGMDYPHFNITVSLDITAFYNYIKKRNFPLYTSLIHAVIKIINTQEAFKMRIRDGRVVRHDYVHPSYADIRRGEELFRFVTVDYNEDIENFNKQCRITLDNQKTYFETEALKGRDDLVFISCIPWVSYSHISHTTHFRKDDSFPRISWGKYSQDGKVITLPFSVQVNHALVDGIHVGRFINTLQEYLDTSFHEV